MGGPINVCTTTLPSGSRASHRLCNNSIASTKGRWEHSKQHADVEVINSPETLHESHPQMLLNHFYCDNGAGDWLTTVMDQTSNQGPSSSYTVAGTVGKTPDTRMVNKLSVNKNNVHLISIKPRKCTATVSTYVWKDRDNRDSYPPAMVDTNCKNQNRDNKRQRQRPICQNPIAVECDNSHNLHRWLWHRE